jgi:hypothetical protein
MGELAQATGIELTPCQEEPELFFPEGYLGKADPGDTVNGEPDYHSEQSMAARAKCAGCWFKQECLEIGIAISAEYGIYGGLDPDERTMEVIKRGMQGAGLR